MVTSMPKTGSRKNAYSLALAGALALASCSAQNGDSGATGPTADATGIEAMASSAPAVDHFSGTAWRAISEEGARFTTYLDPGGIYRDFRNGDPWQTGRWVFFPEGDSRICLTPDAENGRRTCWTPDRSSERGVIMKGEGGRRIELQRVEYSAPIAADLTEG